jgi:hypothetical protein
MNRKQFILLLALVAVLGAAGLWVRWRDHESWQGTAAIGQKLLPNLAVNDIAQVTIMSGTNELHLARRDNLWLVQERGDYPANFSQISELLLKLADLKIVQTEEIGPSQLGRFELLPPGTATNTGTLVALTDAGGKVLATLMLGKKHLHQGAADSSFGGAWPDGRYVQAGGGKVVALVSDPLESVETEPVQWLNKDFFSIEKPCRITVQFPGATNSWTLTRASETNDWQLADARPGEKLDAAKVSGVSSPFTSPVFSDVLGGNNEWENSGLTNVTGVTVATFDGFNYTARIGPAREGNFPVAVAVTADLPTERTPAKTGKPEEKARLDEDFKARQKTLAEKLAREKSFEHWTYLVPSYTVDSLLKTRNQLLTEPKTNELASLPSGK